MYVISRRDNQINLSSLQSARAIILGGFSVSCCMYGVSRTLHLGAHLQQTLPYCYMGTGSEMLTSLNYL